MKSWLIPIRELPKEYLPVQRKRRYDLRGCKCYLYLLRSRQQWRNLKGSMPLPRLGKPCSLTVSLGNCIVKMTSVKYQSASELLKFNKKTTSNNALLSNESAIFPSNFTCMKSSRRDFLLKTIGIAAITPLASQCMHEGLPPLLEIITPNGGELLIPQTLNTIRWKAIGVGPLLIELSVDDGKNWVTIEKDVPPEPEFLEWQTPRVNSAQCLLRISDMQEPELQDESDAVFSIQPILKLTYPNGGEVLNPQEKLTIRWEAAGTGNLVIELSSIAAIYWIKIAENVSSQTGFYELNLPARDSDKCLIRVTDIGNTALQDQSDAFFTIRQTEVILLSEHPELQKLDGFKVFDNASLGALAVLVTGVNTFKVLSLSCTHAGCGVSWGGAGFSCPCHGSGFDKNGCVLNGPAQTPLRNYVYEFDATKGVLTVFNQIKSGTC